MFNLILISIALLFSIALIVFLIYVNTGITLLPDTDEVIKTVVAGELPEYITGEIGKAKSGKVNIWYEKINPKGRPKGTILLVMGHSASAMVWTTNFYQPLLDEGYQVIRYDNRDVGESDWIKDWDKKKPYTLEDMAKDGMAVLDAAGVNQAHIIGVSMGGMIAQRMAISHSNRVLSLTSIMSSGYMLDPEITAVSKEYIQNFTKLGLKYLITRSEKGVMKFSVGMHQLLKGNGPYEVDIEASAKRSLYEVRKRKGLNAKVAKQQYEAIVASGSRYKELGNIKAPTLVIHGKSDPLVIFAHAQKYAPMIPNATTLFIDGMGHDLPDCYLGQMQAAILGNFEKVAKTVG